MEQISQGNVLQAAPGTLASTGIKGLVVLVELVHRQQAAGKLPGNGTAHRFTGGVNGIYISHLHKLRQISFRRQHQHLGDHGLIEAGIQVIGNSLVKIALAGLDQARIDLWCLTALNLSDHFLNHIHCQALTGFPAIKAIGIMAHQEHQLVTAVGISQFYWCRKAPQQTRNRFFQHIGKHKRLLCLGHVQHHCLALWQAFKQCHLGYVAIFCSTNSQGHVDTRTIQQTNSQRQMERQLGGLAGGGRARLRHI